MPILSTRHSMAARGGQRLGPCPPPTRRRMPLCGPAAAAATSPMANGSRTRRAPDRSHRDSRTRAASRAEGFNDQRPTRPDERSRRRCPATRRSHSLQDCQSAATTRRNHSGGRICPRDRGTVSRPTPADQIARQAIAVPVDVGASADAPPQASPPAAVGSRDIAWRSAAPSSTGSRGAREPSRRCRRSTACRRRSPRRDPSTGAHSRWTARGRRGEQRVREPSASARPLSRTVVLRAHRVTERTQPLGTDR